MTSPACGQAFKIPTAGKVSFPSARQDQQTAPYIASGSLAPTVQNVLHQSLCNHAIPCIDREESPIERTYPNALCRTELAGPGSENSEKDTVSGCLLSASVAAVIDAALASGDSAGIDTVARYARQAHPEAATEIDRRVAVWRRKQVSASKQDAEAETRSTVATKPLEEAAHSSVQAAVKWAGEGEVGAFTSSGNAPGIGFVGSAKLVLEGKNWRIESSGRIDYQETANVVTRDQYRFSAEPNIKFSKRGYMFGLGQYEKDRFQGFISRYSLSGGLGYYLFSRPDAKVNLKAGPAWRRTTGTRGEKERILAGLASLDVNVKLTSALRFTQDASVYVDARGSTIYTLAALDTKLLGKLNARFSYMVQHETEPEPGSLATDATSRLTLVYGF